MDRDGVAELYYRGAGEEYSSLRCIQQSLKFNSNPQNLKFHIDRNCRDIDSIDFLFFSEPPEQPIAYLKIYSVTIRAANPVSDTSTVLTMAIDQDQLRTLFTLRSLSFNNRLLGELYVVNGENPGLEWSLPRLQEAEAGSTLEFEIVLDYLPDESYILARDQFLSREERFSEQIRDLESRIAELEISRQQFDHYKASALWSKFVRAQQWYDRLAGAGLLGAISSSLRVLNPRWWARRETNGYERWRTANDFQNRPDE